MQKFVCWLLVGQSIGYRRTGRRFDWPRHRNWTIVADTVTNHHAGGWVKSWLQESPFNYSDYHMRRARIIEIACRALSLSRYRCRPTSLEPIGKSYPRWSQSSVWAATAYRFHLTKKAVGSVHGSVFISSISNKPTIRQSNRNHRQKIPSNPKHLALTSNAKKITTGFINWTPY